MRVGEVRVGGGKGGEVGVGGWEKQGRGYAQYRVYTLEDMCIRVGDMYHTGRSYV